MATPKGSRRMAKILSAMALSVISTAAWAQTQTNCQTIGGQTNCTTYRSPGVQSRPPFDAAAGLLSGQAAVERNVLAQQQAEILARQGVLIGQQRDLLRQQQTAPAISSADNTMGNRIGALVRSGQCKEAVLLAKAYGNDGLIGYVAAACPAS